MNIKYAFFTLVLIGSQLSLPVSSFCQTFRWAHNMGDSARAETTGDLFVDKDGNSYIVGSLNGYDGYSFGGMANFICGSFTGPTSNTEVGYVEKFDSSGSCQWVRPFIGTPVSILGGTPNYPSVFVNAVTGDDQGNIYFTGIITASYGGQTVDFDPGPGVANLSVLPAPMFSPTMFGYTPVTFFLAKYNTNGDYVWAKELGYGWPGPSPKDLLIDHAGNIFITGALSDSMHLSQGAGYIAMEADGGGGSDVFLAKFDPGGSYLWSFNFGITKGPGLASNDAGTAIAVDQQDNIYLTGNLSGQYDTVDFDPGPGIAAIPTVPIGNSDIFLSKYDSSGHYVWAKIMGSWYTENSNAIQVDDSGDVYITGIIKDGAADLDPSPDTALLNVTGMWEMFVAKYDDSGNYLWARGSEGGILGGTQCQAYSLAIDPYDNILVSGTYQGPVDFDPGQDTSVYTSVPGNNGSYWSEERYLAAYDANGSYLSKIDKIGGTSIGLDMNGNAYFSGIFTSGMSSLYSGSPDSSDFDPGPANAYLTATGWSQGASFQSDIFISKYNLYCIGSTVANAQSICPGGVYTINGHTYTTPGIYRDTMQSLLSGCDSIIITNLTTISVDTTVSYNAGNLTAHATGSSYQWFDCNSGQLIAGETGQSFTPVVNGSYAVIISDGSCSDTSACITVTNVGIEYYETSQFSLFPNPSSGVFTLSLPKLEDNTVIEIIDNRGMKVFSESVLNKITIIKPLLQPGIYFVTVSSEASHSRFAKLVIY